MDHNELAQKIEAAAQALQKLCIEKGLKVATAESLTGGMISSSIVDIPGSSAYFDRGFAVYNNTAKREMLGVHKEIFVKFTEVSGQCVEAMAKGAIEHSYAKLSCAVSGVAGPDGGNDINPVGTVWIAVAALTAPCSCALDVYSERFVFAGDRTAVRMQTTLQALLMMYTLAKDGVQALSLHKSQGKVFSCKIKAKH